MSAVREWMKFISGAVFWAIVTHALLWMSGEEPTVLGATVTTTMSMYVVFVGLFAFVLVTSYGFFAQRRDAITLG